MYVCTLTLSPLSFVFCHQLHVIPIDQPDTKQLFQRQSREIYFPPETAGIDWPIALQVSEKFKVVYVLTKFG